MKELVVKDNALIQASYTLGLVEQRLILLAIISAREMKQGIDDRTLIVVRAEDYARHFNVTRQNAYMVLKDAVETLFNRKATVDVWRPEFDKYTPLTVRWVTAMGYEENEARLTLRFGLEVIPLITRLEENFTKYELEQVAGLQSAYAVRLYELLIGYRHWHTVEGKLIPVFELEDFRKQLGVNPKDYTRLDNLKRRVLDIAVSQINEHTNITASYEQVKKGRTVTGFKFSFKLKKKIITIDQNLDSKDKDTLDIFTGLTEKQINYFANLLARSKDMEQFSRVGEDYYQFEERLKQELCDPIKVEKYMPYLIQQGFKNTGVS